MPTLRSSRASLRAALLLSLFALPGAAHAAVSLRGSNGSLDSQNQQARRHGFRAFETRQQVRDAVRQGLLVPVTGNADYTLKEVSFPYARPEIKLFIERLAKSYVRVCGEPLVVTSLTRARRLQPANASWRSVHPTGMALDLRRSWSRRCRAWLEGVLLTLENEGVLEATIEWRPVHYHLAVFPRPYLAHLRGLKPGESEFRVVRYQVARGDTLAKIARRHRTTVEQVKRSNGLRSDVIRTGQVLVIPASR